MSTPQGKQLCQWLQYRFARLCGRPATKFEDGKWYCWQHAPSYREKKSEEHKKAIDRHNEELHTKWEAIDSRRKLETEAGIGNLSDEDLKTITSLGGIHAMISKLSDQSEYRPEQDT